MKKVFTLAALSLITLAGFSQSDNGKIERSKDIILGGDRKRKTDNGNNNGTDVILGRRTDNGGVYNGGSSDRNYRIRDINREYDQKIWEVRNNRTLTAAEKERVIRRLEKERADRIRQVNGYGNNNDRYGKRNGRNHDNDDDDDDDDQGHHDNGKHKGWYKGKGNQKHDHKD